MHSFLSLPPNESLFIYLLGLPGFPGSHSIYGLGSCCPGRLAWLYVALWPVVHCPPCKPPPASSSIPSLSRFCDMPSSQFIRQDLRSCSASWELARAPHFLFPFLLCLSASRLLAQLSGLVFSRCPGLHSFWGHTASLFWLGWGSRVSSSRLHLVRDWPRSPNWAAFASTTEEEAGQETAAPARPAGSS